MKYLVTGGCGFLGSNLASEVLKRGEELYVFDNLSRLGSGENLKWLKTLGCFQFVNGDIRNQNDITRVIKHFKPDVVFHLAGQVAMTTSIDNPRLDFETNVIGSINVLEAVREFMPEAVVIYSSTNKVYGDFEWMTYSENKSRYICDDYPIGFPETMQLDFHSPYGCSKGAADQYMLDYHRMFGLNTIVFRHSSMFGTRQYSSYDQGWIGWFCQKAVQEINNAALEQFTISGTGKQVRDVLFADDMISLYFNASSKKEIASGQAFNIGGGVANSLSILELFSFFEDEYSIKLNYRKIPERKSDQKIFIADISKAEKLLGWTPNVESKEGIKKMVTWILQNKADDAFPKR